MRYWFPQIRVWLPAVVLPQLISRSTGFILGVWFSLRAAPFGSTWHWLNSGYLSLGVTLVTYCLCGSVVSWMVNLHSVLLPDRFSLDENRRIVIRADSSFFPVPLSCFLTSCEEQIVFWWHQLTQVTYTLVRGRIFPTTPAIHTSYWSDTPNWYTTSVGLTPDRSVLLCEVLVCYLWCLDCYAYATFW